MDLTISSTVNSSWVAAIIVKNFPSVNFIDLRLGESRPWYNRCNSKKTLVWANDEEIFARSLHSSYLDRIFKLTDNPVVICEIPLFKKQLDDASIPNIIWPNWCWVDDAITQFLLQDNIHFVPKKNDSVAFASLNRRTTPERRYLLSVLYNTNLIRHGHVTDNSNPTVKIPGVHYHNDLIHYSKNMPESLNSDLMGVPCSSNLANLNYINNCIPGRVLLQCETTLDFYYPGEKAHQAFALRRIPLTIGVKNAADHLREQGFDLYDDIVDYSYQTVHNKFCRIKIAVENNQSILENPVDWLYMDRANYNYNHLTTTAWQGQVRSLLDQIEQALDV
jgi:hypothetical protein